MIRLFAVLATLMFAAPALAQSLPANLDKANAIVIDTNKGRIVVKLRTDLAPKHAERIKQLAREGYYDNVPFHRVIDGFMAQTGDGKNFNGTGGSKYPNLAGRIHQYAVQARHRRHGARRRSEFGEFAVLHHVRRRLVPERQVHRGRRGPKTR
jgi:hypothetical protein